MVWGEKTCIRIYSKIANGWESRKMSLLKNSLNYFKHPTHITPIMRYKQGYSIVQSPASCTDSLRGLSIFSVKNLPSQAARAQVASSEAGKLLSGLHNCSPEWSAWFPPQVSRQPLLMIFSPDVGVNGGRKGEWSGQGPESSPSSHAI